MSDFPYSIPERRSLREEELAMLRRLLGQVAPDRLTEVDTLEVRGRCGCGKCPTSMFVDSPEPVKEGQTIVADFQGGDEATGCVGIILWERDGMLSELEAWSFGGRDISGWPALDTVRPLDAAQSK